MRLADTLSTSRLLITPFCCELRRNSTRGCPVPILRSFACASTVKSIVSWSLRRVLKKSFRCCQSTDLQNTMGVKQNKGGTLLGDPCLRSPARCDAKSTLVPPSPNQLRAVQCSQGFADSRQCTEYNNPSRFLTMRRMVWS